MDKMNKMRILNLVDDEKFIDGLITEYDFFNQSTKFVILTEKPGSENYKYIKNINRVHKIAIGSDEYQELLRGEAFDVVWVHYRNKLKMQFVNQIKEQCPDKVVVWSSWGADLYILLGLPLFGPRTLWTQIKNNKIRTTIGLCLRRILAYTRVNRLLWTRDTQRFLKNIDVATTILKEEWPFMARVLKKNVIFLPFVYTAFPCKKIETFPVTDLSSTQVWLGNSATYENNHFDVLPILSKLKDYSVVAPLSYGPIGKIVEKEGQKILGSRWFSLKEFMPIDEYRKRMASCSMFVFPHRRQQALGNVMVALKFGGCVFLDPVNPIYSYPKNNNILVYTLNDLENNFKFCLREFAEKQKENRQRVFQIASESKFVEELQVTFTKLQTLADKKIAEFETYEKGI